MTRKFLKLLLSGFLLVACHNQRIPDPREEVRSYIISSLDSLEFMLELMINSAEQNKLQDVREKFKTTRLIFKRIELITEFHFPGVSKVVNGPAIDKAEEYDDNINYATGFQVIEEFLFPQVDSLNVDEMIGEIEILRSTISRLQMLAKGNVYTDENIFQAVRLQPLRIMSLGITGFDSPVALHSIPEAIASLEGMREILSPYRHQAGRQWLEVAGSIESAQNYLKEHQDFNTFDRLSFITSYMRPLSKHLYKYQDALAIDNNKWIEAVHLSKEHFFEDSVFRVDFFAPKQQNVDEAALTSLGRVLFFDPALSGNNKRACASCHRPEKAFSDGQPKSVSFNLAGNLKRNAPSLINAGFQQTQFWDQRAHFLEDQILDVVTNKDEMHGNLPDAVRRLSVSKEYRDRFAAAFKDGASLGVVTEKRIRRALSAYVRSLQGMDTRFDRYLRDGSAELTREEIDGFNVFMGKGKCATCHFFPLFNGSVPPSYQETESEVLGVPLRPDTANATVDPDLGKYVAYPRELFRHAFKTPGIRNAALTAPYMHNGVYASLEEVVDFYNRGGGEGIGISLPNQTLPPEPLNLTNAERKNLIAFIQVLTDTARLTRIPARLPSIDNPGWNKRTIGGEY